jgi:prepilin-type N-terminal cleavage/methylation domain-containing protein
MPAFFLGKTMRVKGRGFTLVEIAIVLVIVGLLLGGILKGQEMVTQAKIKNSIADFSGISAAYFGYQDRYRVIPGDDPNASRWALGRAGNGDGIVQGAYNAACPTGAGQPIAGTAESCLFWSDLRLSGFVSGSGAQQPFNAFTGMVGVQSGDSLGATALGGFAGLIICSANIPDKVAIAMDTQMDDGVIGTGAARAQLQTAPNPAINALADAAPYAETGSNVYVICRSL